MGDLLTYIGSSLGIALDFKSIDLTEYILFGLYILAGLYHLKFTGDRMLKIATHWKTYVAVLGAIVATRLAFSQYELYDRVKKSSDATISALQTKLTAIGLERRLLYINSTFDQFNNDDKRDECIVRAHVRIGNRGDSTLNSKFYGVVITVNGDRHSLPQEIDSTVDGGEVVTLNTEAVKLTGCYKYPRTYRLEFHIDYDNLVPVKVRHMHRIEATVANEKQSHQSVIPMDILDEEN